MSPADKYKAKSLQDNLHKSRFGREPMKSVCVCGVDPQSVPKFLRHIFACRDLLKRQQYPRPASHTAECHYRAAVQGKGRTEPCRHGFHACPFCDPCDCGFR